MPLSLFNTRSGKKETFVPIKEGEVSMYHCGPTVYDFAHIGNLRAYVFADTLRRACEAEGLKVRQVINITDIGHLSSDADDGDDKMMKGLKREGLPATFGGLKALADKYTKAFFEDLKALNIKTDGTKFPRATEYVKDDVALIKLLEEKALAYRTKDGVYFDTEKFPEYGALGGLTPLSDLKERVESDGKKSPRDFALWKFTKEGRLGFESPWGVGFPGWHVECSVMSERLLGQPFDIHTGGVDHIPVHHNNEIAQSEGAYGKPLANIWMHGAFITVNDAKMAKSAGGFTTLQSLTEKGFSPLSYRYFVLGAQYRSPINFSEEALEGAKNAYRRLSELFVNLGTENGSVDKEYRQKFEDAVNDDLNTPQALAVLWELVKDQSVSPADKRATLLEFDVVLGLDLDGLGEQLKNMLLPEEVKRFVKEREEARKAGDFKKSDELRGQIQKLGFSVEDTSDGQKIRPL